jgi:hypothetical protein
MRAYDRKNDAKKIREGEGKRPEGVAKRALSAKYEMPKGRDGHMRWASAGGDQHEA